MNGTFEYETRPATRTVFAPCELTAADCELQATRLRSWALIRGETITGLPFLRLGGSNSGEVHLPVEGSIVPHPEVGVAAGESPAGAIAAVPGVDFVRLQETVRELEGPAAVDHAASGPAEFHPAGRDAWKRGTLAWPVRVASGAASRRLAAGVA